jgi:glycosyltransferase involved in cell wall biosynthesis
MNFNTPFQVPQQKIQVSIDPDTKVVFVADLFVEQYVGGAELTTDAISQKCPYKYQRVMSKDLTTQLLEQGVNAFWVFGNFASMNLELVPSIVANLRYAILEYDYKYCRYRSPEKHKYAEQNDCDCDNSTHGKMISAFYFGAKNLFWMSESQMEHYFKLFPFLRATESAETGPQNIVLSSVFDDNFFFTIKHLRQESAGKERSGWIVLGSSSWVKGADLAEQWCKEAGLAYEVVWNLPYPELLKKLSVTEGFVYLPRGNDTCPRMVIEAKLLGCRLHVNDYVQQRHEEWFDTDNLRHIEEYLYGSREMFWRNVARHIDYEPTVSGYLTTKDCIAQKYPFRDCIRSMLIFCDEVVVVDGGSTDGTWEELQRWAESDIALKVHQLKRDWGAKRFAVFDGELKAEARKLCTKEFCWQMDADEVVPEGDGKKVKNICKTWPALGEIISLPVVEYWGSENKVRVDVNPWKWRLSKNLPHITHGIPSDLRRFDECGDLYASPGTDGCDYVHAKTFERIPHISFYGEGAHNVRFAALNGNKEALTAYEQWLQNSVDMLPSVRHYSWFDIARKIKTYREYWQKHWESLYNIEQKDTAENNMFFDKPWTKVTDEEIDVLAARLAKETGGHIFHTKIDWSHTVPHVNIK